MEQGGSNKQEVIEFQGWIQSTACISLAGFLAVPALGTISSLPQYVTFQCWTHENNDLHTTEEDQNQR